MFERIEFAKQNIPTPYENLNVADDVMVKYGSNNAYPDFLLKLYSESPIHASIINGKATYIVGNGVLVNDAESIVKVNAAEDLNEFVGKCIKDFLIFNFFAVEVIRNTFGQVIEYHFVPANYIRMNKSKTRFWFSEDYTGRKSKTIEYNRFNPFSTDTTSTVYLYDGYFPSKQSVYPMPEYSGSIKSISTDIAIKDFNLHNISNNFSVSTLITLKNGEPTNEIKQRFVDNLKENYTGSKGEKFIVSFQNANSEAPDVQQLGDNSWADAYNSLSVSVTDDIMRGHSVTSGMLFGIKESGQLGGSTELETAYEIFKNTYVISKRTELENAFNQLFLNSTIVTGKITFGDKPLFNTQISDTLKEKIYTINELRKEAGLPALNGGDRLLSEQPAAVSESFSEQKKSDVESRKLTEEDFELVKDLGSLKADFEAIFDMQFDAESDVAKFVTDNDIKGLTVPEIQALMRDENITVTQNEIVESLENLKAANYLDYTVSDDNRISVKPQPEGNIPDSDRIRVMYEYEKKPEVSGSKLISTSRSFCRKLIENNRYYSREDIQSMSSIFGYSIWDYCGGFFHDPTTGKTTPSCRHYWKRVIVKPRKNNNSNNAE